MDTPSVQWDNLPDLLQDPLLLLTPGSSANAHPAANIGIGYTPEDSNTAILNTRIKTSQVVFQQEDQKIVRVSRLTASNRPNVSSTGQDGHEARAPSSLKVVRRNRGKRLSLSIRKISDLPLQCVSI